MEPHENDNAGKTSGFDETETGQHGDEGEGPRRRPGSRGILIASHRCCFQRHTPSRAVQTPPERL